MQLGITAPALVGDLWKSICRAIACGTQKKMYIYSDLGILCTEFSKIEKFQGSQ